MHKCILYHVRIVAWFVKRESGESKREQDWAKTR